MQRRATYVGFALATIAIGLLVHFHGAALGPTGRDFLGDALWAAMIVWLVSALVPGARVSARCLAAYGVSAMVELSQLYHSPTLDAARATTVGHLVLGTGFDARDFVAYAVGLGGAAVIDTALERFVTRRA